MEIATQQNQYNCFYHNFNKYRFFFIHENLETSNKVLNQ